MIESLPGKIFMYSNYTAMIGWLLLVVAPRWRGTNVLVQTGLFPFLTGILYMILFFTSGKTTGGYGSLNDVYQLFGNKQVLLAGWLHYLGFDLFIGSWQVKEAQKHNIHHLMVVPCLLLTFWFGPAGLALFFILRIVKTKQIVHENF